MSDWLQYLYPDEAQALAEVDQWIDSGGTGAVARMLTFTHKPMEYAYQALPESVRESINRAISSTLHTMRDGSSVLVSRRSVLDRVASHSGQQVRGPRDLFYVSIRTLDVVATDYLNLARAGATIGGATAGTAGVVGLVADVPALYGILFKMIQEVAFVYGFHVKPPQEKAHILKVLDTGHYMEPEKKRRGMEELEALQDRIRQGIHTGDLDRYLLTKGLQTIARHLSISLAERKIGQTVFLVGGVIGAGVNHQLARDVGWVAYYAYRRRFLKELALRRMAGEV
ncbi:MAG: EcsC family protein [Armatimonadetes bacterium]|nr:EcsC family protein [Armatimonadota bacterium]